MPEAARTLAADMWLLRLIPRLLPDWRLSLVLDALTRRMGR